jgi:deazaflavin-dependent oxidoreductase (nitroreductase family)
VASFAGVHEPPAWYLNLVAEPRVSTELAGTRTRCVARVLDDDQAAGVWPHLDEGYHGFSRYRRRTSRRLPIVELIPERAAAP